MDNGQATKKAPWQIQRAVVRRSGRHAQAGGGFPTNVAGNGQWETTANSTRNDTTKTIRRHRTSEDTAKVVTARKHPKGEATMADNAMGITESVAEKVLIEGDLSQLSPADRVQYYIALCKSVGLNPLSKPFEYLKLEKK